MTALDQLARISIGEICSMHPLVSVPSETPVSDALQKMKDHRVTCVGVTKNGAVAGMLDIRDLMLFLAFGKYKSSETGAPFKYDEKTDLVGKPVGELMGASDGGRVWLYKATDPVQKLMEPFGKGVRHAAVQTDDSYLWRLVTQTDVVRWVATNSAFAPVLAKSISSLGMARSHVVACTDQDTAIECFRKAAQNQVGAVAIVDHRSGRIVANLSGADLRGLDAADVRTVEQPVLQYLGVQKLNSTHPVVVRPEESLKSVVYKVLAHKIHRVWVVDDAGKPTAVITMSDILSKFGPFSPEMTTENAVAENPVA